MVGSTGSDKQWVSGKGGGREGGREGRSGKGSYTYYEVYQLELIVDYIIFTSKIIISMLISI